MFFIVICQKLSRECHYKNKYYQRSGDKNRHHYYLRALGKIIKNKIKSVALSETMYLGNGQTMRLSL